MRLGKKYPLVENYQTRSVESRGYQVWVRVPTQCKRAKYYKSFLYFLSFFQSMGFHHLPCTAFVVMLFPLWPAAYERVEKFLGIVLCTPNTFSVEWCGAGASRGGWGNFIQPRANQLTFPYGNLTKYNSKYVTLQYFMSEVQNATSIGSIYDPRAAVRFTRES